MKKPITATLASCALFLTGCASQMSISPARKDDLKQCLNDQGIYPAATNIDKSGKPYMIFRESDKTAVLYGPAGVIGVLMGLDNKPQFAPQPIRPEDKPFLDALHNCTASVAQP